MRTIESYVERYSDFYKETWGVRPRHDTKHWALQEWEREFDFLSRICEDNAKQEAASQAAAADAFEANIRTLIGMGAANRETAIRWIAEGEGVDLENDAGYLCYKLGLPDGYLKQTVAA